MKFGIAYANVGPFGFPEPLAHLARTASRVRAARSANGTPSASNSSSSQPIPMPRIARPPERTSSVATSFAT